MTNIAFIPARGDSKSIPLKNIKVINGKPLIWWILKSAVMCPIIDKVVVATENEQIKATVLSFGFDKVEVYNRDPSTAQDTSPTIDVVMEYLNDAKPSPDDLFFLLQATSPLTRCEDILGIYHKLTTSNLQTALSCVKCKRFFWQPDGYAINYDCQNRPRRQDFDGYLMENGAIYLAAVGSILRQKSILAEPAAIYEMPSYTDVELDEIHDWIVVENLMKRYLKLSPPLVEPPLF